MLCQSSLLPDKTALGCLFFVHENGGFCGQEQKNVRLVHKKGRFHGRERKNEPAVHKKGCFHGRGPGYLLYLHDLGVILSESEGFV